MIRSFTLITVLILSATICFANEGPFSFGRSRTSVKSNTVNFTLQLNNGVSASAHVDSVYVVLDKFDHTGAGIVNKIFPVMNNNQVVIDNLPEGRYYAEVYTMGNYPKHFSLVIRANQKNNKTIISFDNDVYTPGQVTIPADSFKSFANSYK